MYRVALARQNLIRSYYHVRRLDIDSMRPQAVRFPS